MSVAQWANLGAMLVAPFLIAGVILRVKSLWSGRRGQPILQPLYDVIRLMRKRPVYSSVTTPLFRIAPWVFLLTAMATALVTPLLGFEPVMAFPFDFVWLAYAWGLGRIGIMLAALDTGSSFEGMGAAREATFATLIEPALFVAIGALCLSTGGNSLSGVLQPSAAAGAPMVAKVFAIAALLIVLQVESARLPVDDPTTHLELTMVHEVMILDHSGPDLAAIQTGAALKFFIGTSIIATLINPWAGEPGVLAAAVNLALAAVVAAVVATVESLIARLRLRVVPHYIAVGVGSAVIALLAAAWESGALL